MKITKPKKQLFTFTETFYVSSDSGGEKHIVVRADKTYFCDCKDFMTRSLPLLNTPGFSLCKHGKFVRDSAPSKEPKTPLKTLEKQFAVFAIWESGVIRRSLDVRGTYPSKELAQSALNNYHEKYPTSRMKREVRECQD